MGRVDQPIDAVLGQIGGEARRAAKAADADAARQRAGLLGSAGERRGDAERIAEAGERGAGECGGFAGAAEDQELLRRHPPTRARKRPSRSTIVQPRRSGLISCRAIGRS